nr:hypothetical protein CFP56_75472 [Quercus suber]
MKTFNDSSGSEDKRLMRVHEGFDGSEKKESKFSKEAGYEPFSTFHQASSPEFGVPTTPLEKVTSGTLFSNISNIAVNPVVRELEDPPPGFGEQLSSIKKFGNTLYDIVAEKEKGEVMEAADGNMELFNIKEPDTKTN